MTNDHPYRWRLFAALVLLGEVAVVLAVPRPLSLAPGNSAVIVIVMTLNGAAGLLFGHLYLRRGIESAMIAHFAADVVLHVLGPALLLE